MLFPAGSSVPWRSLNASRWTSVVGCVLGSWKVTATRSEIDRAPEMITVSFAFDFVDARGAAITTPTASAASATWVTQLRSHVRCIPDLPLMDSPHRHATG